MSSFVGSEEHRELTCRFFIETHQPYDPATVEWPRLDEPARLRLAGMPIWEEAIRIETATALIVQTMATKVRDPRFAEAIVLQGYEESRHAALLRSLADAYGFAVPAYSPAAPRRPEWSFMRVAYGECFDSFFAFGLFALGRESGLFDPRLIDRFEPVMQEEARHIIFHANWIAYHQAVAPLIRRAPFMFRRALAVWMQIVNRCRTVLRLSRGRGRQRHFTLDQHTHFANISPRAFIARCLVESQRRLGIYDPRLLRPAFVPAIARATMRALRAAPQLQRLDSPGEET
jgi:hypothetical protein